MNILMQRESRDGCQLSASDKLQAINTLALQWATHLSGSECKLLLWLFANTIVRGKRSGTYSVSQIVSGVRKADRSGYWCAGTGLSKRAVQYAIPSLRARGVIFTRSGEKGISFVINLKWRVPSSENESFSDVVEESVTNVLPGGPQRTPLGMPRGGAKMTPPRVQNLHPINRKTLQEEDQVTTTATASGDDGVMSAGEKIPGISSRVKSVHSTRQENPTNNATGYQQTWIKAWREGGYEALPIQWTIKDAGMIKRALANWSDRLGSRHDFIEWSVANWKLVVRAKFGWMTKVPAPTVPVPAFFAIHIRAFMDAWCDAETLRWIGTQTGTEQRYAQLRHAGMSHDGATLEVAMEQARSIDREKRAADLRAAKRTLQLAEAAAKRGGATRFTAENPHPRAHENTRHVPVTPTEDGDGSFVAAPLPRLPFDD